jgi:integrase
MNNNMTEEEHIKKDSDLDSLRTNSKKLRLKPTDQEDLLKGIKKNGVSYSVRKHRKTYFMPDIWVKLMENLNGKAEITADTLIQTGCRINEGRHSENRDIDYDRNTLRLRIVKTKAKKKGEDRGVPRTIPISTEFTKKLKKHFKNLPKGSKIGFLSTNAFNTALKKALKKIGIKDYYMYSAHSIRKTHGNYLKIMANAGMMKVDATEICLRLGHDYNTFLKDYGSPGVMNNSDLILIKSILGDLYANR